MRHVPFTVRACDAEAGSALIDIARLFETTDRRDAKGTRSTFMVPILYNGSNSVSSEIAPK